MRYLWQGNNISQAAALYQDGSTKHATYYSYELGTHRPLAQIQNQQAQYFVLDANGTPEEIYNASGQIVEALNLETWGKTRIQRKVASGGYQEYQTDPCPIRFQGQWQDEESGLYYNRYRYYDPEISQYISPDPIGLAGGAVPTAYVHQPTGWVDPLGLNSQALARNLGIAPNSGQAAHHLIPEQVWKENQKMFDALGMKMDAASNGISMPISSDGTEIAHVGSHPVYSRNVGESVSHVRNDLRAGRINDDQARSRLEGIQSDNRC